MPLLEHFVLRLVNLHGRRGPPSAEEALRCAKEEEEDEEEEDSDYSEEEEEEPLDEETIASEDRRELDERTYEALDAVIALGYGDDPRFRVETIHNPDAVRSKDTYENVRRYTLQQWKERVHHRRAGPWSDPQTQQAPPLAGQIRLGY